MFHFAAKIVATLVVGLMALGCSASDGTYKDCARFKAALEKPSVMRLLEDFYVNLPKEFDRSALNTASYRLAGIGRYTIPLGFDPSKIGLNADAEVRLSLVEGGDSLASLVITDVRGSMFYFRVNDNIENFERATLVHPRGNRVGVKCLRRD